MTGLYACGVSAAIHTILAERGVECPHCKASQEGATR